MSMKSFDDFCARIVNNEPLSQKQILDERQKVIRQKITLNAAFLFVGLSVVNTFIMDLGLKWCEMFLLPMTWFYIISYIYWIIENYRKGSLFGVDGTRSLRQSGSIMLFICFPSSLTFFGESFSVLRNGMISSSFALLIYVVLVAICGIILLILVKKYRKREKTKE